MYYTYALKLGAVGDPCGGRRRSTKKQKKKVIRGVRKARERIEENLNITTEEKWGVGIVIKDS